MEIPILQDIVVILGLSVLINPCYPKDKNPEYFRLFISGDYCRPTRI